MRREVSVPQTNSTESDHGHKASCDLYSYGEGNLDEPNCVCGKKKDNGNEELSEQEEQRG